MSAAENAAATQAVNFRKMSAADVLAAEALEAQSFHDAWNRQMLLDELNNGLAHYLVLEADGELLGYAGFWLVAGEAQITRVAVAAAKRNCGLGSLLTAALVRLAWELGAEAVTLEVRAGNKAAQQVYHKAGFAAAGVRPRYYEDNHEDAVIMWLYK